MDAVISSLDKHYRLCDTRISESEIILYIQGEIICPKQTESRMCQNGASGFAL